MTDVLPSAVHVTLTGRVQGLGVRPAIARWARQLSLMGWVSNTCRGVEIVVGGTSDEVEQFIRELPQRLPRAAIVESQECAPIEPPMCKTFAIRSESVSGALKVRVPPDLAACEDCLRETRSATDRRSRYPFASCTACGPRYSIIEKMPYERAHTTMRNFTLCPICQREFNSPADRRYHAETTACPACGPHWWCCDNTDRTIATGRDAIQAAAATILRGEIVALQGLGGYQLIVDATSETAVNRLRTRKQRNGKPFAVMVASVEQALRLARCDQTERQALASPAGPIVILDQQQGNELAHGVSPGLDTLGLMLPTSPLHDLLLIACGRPLVVTSGNREGDPLEFEHRGAHTRLAAIADLWLEHNRPIRRPVDDSVVRVIAGRVAVLRLARGFAPLPLEVHSPKPLLAIGGHHKAAIAISNGAQGVLGPHVGDLDSVAERERWETHVADLQNIYGSSPVALTGDLHPDYYSKRWAATQPLPCMQVQHHHAHIVAGMVEHRWLDRAVLGVAFDGTGLGDDGTIWGGEFLLATSAEFKRVAHVLPFDLPGGERAVREPWRVAVSLAQRAVGSECASKLAFQAGSPQVLLPLIGNPRFSPVTTSAGRLFDGIAALLLGVEVAQFEGQGPMVLEAVCDRTAAGCYPMPLQGTRPCVLDWRPAVVQILGDLQAAVAPSVIAMRFHRGLAKAVLAVARRYPQSPVVLGGGCFQNRILVELLVEMFAQTGQLIGLPGLIPVNDGGLAAGQLAIASSQLENQYSR